MRRNAFLAAFALLVCAGCVSAGAARLDPVSCLGPDAPVVRALPADRADVPPVLVGGLAGLLERLEVPEAARHRTTSAKTVIQLVVGADGAVVCSDVVQGDNRPFNEAARRAVHASTFVPGERGGQPVAVVMGLPFSFQTRTSVF